MLLGQESLPPSSWAVGDPFLGNSSTGPLLANTALSLELVFEGLGGMTCRARGRGCRAVLLSDPLSPAPLLEPLLPVGLGLGLCWAELFRSKQRTAGGGVICWQCLPRAGGESSLG